VIEQNEPQSCLASLHFPISSNWSAAHSGVTTYRVRVVGLHVAALPIGNAQSCAFGLKKRDLRHSNAAVVAPKDTRLIVGSNV
jgi:hypothetical protein